MSSKILDDELAQNRSMSTAIPAVFLGVAAFLLNLVLGRLIATQRTEIGTLKAFGYTDLEVGLHYLSYSLVSVALGTIVGVLAGVWAGGAMVALYGEYFNFPVLEYRLSWTLVAIGSGATRLTPKGVTQVDINLPSSSSTEATQFPTSGWNSAESTCGFFPNGPDQV